MHVYVITIGNSVLGLECNAHLVAVVAGGSGRRPEVARPAPDVVAVQPVAFEHCGGPILGVFARVVGVDDGAC